MCSNNKSVFVKKCLLVFYICKVKADHRVLSKYAEVILTLAVCEKFAICEMTSSISCKISNGVSSAVSELLHSSFKENAVLF